MSKLVPTQVVVREEAQVADRRRAGIEDPFGNRVELIEAATDLTEI